MPGNRMPISQGRVAIPHSGRSFKPHRTTLELL
jgi:hypothetical protein